MHNSRAFSVHRKTDRPAAGGFDSIFRKTAREWNLGRLLGNSAGYCPTLMVLLVPQAWVVSTKGGSLLKQPIYNTALYLRLSRDDENEGDSNSIQTQRMMLRDYTQTHGLLVADEYVDDGWSGTNYEVHRVAILAPFLIASVIDIRLIQGYNCAITIEANRP